SRVSTDEDIGQQMMGQLFSNPTVLYITAGIIGLIGMIPNMPHLAFISFAILLAAIGYQIQKTREARSAAIPLESDGQQAAAQEAAAEASWDDVRMVEPLALEVGYRLIPLVDASGKNPELLSRIRSLRKKFAQDMG